MRSIVPPASPATASREIDGHRAGLQPAAVAAGLSVGAGRRGRRRPRRGRTRRIAEQLPAWRSSANGVDRRCGRPPGPAERFACTAGTTGRRCSTACHGPRRCRRRSRRRRSGSRRRCCWRSRSPRTVGVGGVGAGQHRGRGDHRLPASPSPSAS